MSTADAAKVPPKTKRQAKVDRLAARERFRKAHRAEVKFGRQLRMVAKQVGNIVKTLAPAGDVSNLPQLNQALAKYADMLRPWAKAVAESMVAEVGQRDGLAWAELGRDLGRSLRTEIKHAPTGASMRQIMAEAEDLITSLPLKAAQRVHELAIEGMSSSTRARETAKEIERTGQVTASRAMLIARTETTRAATAMVHARAKFIGSEGYIWRTAGDSDVRKLHKKLEGKFVRWDEPPVAGEHGERAHAGAIYNCRCYPEPVIPDDV